jgi:hypothetical protein
MALAPDHEDKTGYRQEREDEAAKLCVINPVEEIYTHSGTENCREGKDDGESHHLTREQPTPTVEGKRDQLVGQKKGL